MMLADAAITLPVWAVSVLVGVVGSALALWAGLTRTLTRLELRVADAVDGVKALQPHSTTIPLLAARVDALEERTAKVEVRLEIVAKRTHDLANAINHVQGRLASSAPATDGDDK